MPISAHLDREITSFLAKDGIVDAMISASEHGRPAVEAIDDALIRRFGDVVEANAVKQRIGRLVRPVMEARGFLPIKRRCPAKSVLFTAGTVYGLSPPIMEVLDKHGIDASVDDVSREIQSAIEMVGGNRPFAERSIEFAWKEHSNIALAPPEGPVGIFGHAVDQALEDAAAKRDAAVPDSQLTSAQLALMRRQGSANAPTVASIDPLAKTAFKLGALYATALTPSRAARLLDRDCDRVEEWVRERRLYGLPLGNGKVGRLPLFQFDDGGRLLPHVTQVFPKLDRTIHPVGVFNWFTSPNPDLVTRQTDFEAVAPRDWLTRGYRPGPISRLAGTLAVGTPS